MKIRKAEISDAHDIYALIEKSKIDRNSKKTSGILEYGVTPEDVTSRIRENELALVACGDVLTGFIIAYTSDFLLSLSERDKKISEDDIMKQVIQYQKPFVYVDILCCAPTLAQHQTALKLHEEVMMKAQRKGIKKSYSAIAVLPWTNISACRFARDEGYVHFDYIETEEGLTFEIYKKDL